MIIGNSSDRPICLLIGGGYQSIPPLGLINVPDNAQTKNEIAVLKKTEVVKGLMDSGALHFNEAPQKNAMPVELPTPEPPADLLVEPEKKNSRVSSRKPRKTGETMTIG